jgi:PAS domain S-box-containing protein
MAGQHSTRSRFAGLVRSIGLHEHLCFVYETQKQQFSAALPFMRAGLERGEKCLYIAKETKDSKAFVAAMRAQGLNADESIKKGSLTFVHSATDPQLKRIVNPRGMIRFLFRAVSEARAGGFPALRIIGEMNWAVEVPNTAKFLIEYEAEVNNLFRENDCLAICQYNLKFFPPEVILGVLRAHPTAIYGDVVSKNPYFVPPEELRQQRQGKQEVQRLLKNIRTYESMERERRRAEEAVKQAENRLRLVIETIPALVWSALPDGSRDFLNQRWLEYSGLSRDEALGWGWTVSIHPEDRATFLEEWHAALAAGKAFETEARLRRADGKYRWFLLRAVPLRDEQGNIVKWYGTSSDIEDRKLAEIQSRALIDAIPQQIWSGPPDGTLDYCNDRWRSYTGLELEDLRGDGWQSMLHPDDRDRVLRAWRESVVNGTPYEQEERHRGADGTYRWFLARGVPLCDADGRIARWYGTNTDIEDRKQAEEKLRHLSGQLLRSQDEERRRIARDLHDATGQDLVALATMLGQLRGSIPSVKRKSRKLHSECMALADTCIREVRTLSYLLHPPVLDEAGLGDAIRDYADGFTKRSGIHVELELSPHVSRMAVDVELVLFRVVQEALTNIQRHSGSPLAKIRIHRNTDLTLEISDLGCGIYASVRKGEKEPRFKVGVGIPGMQERVKLIGGLLVIDSTRRGTTVRVTVPLVANKLEEASHSIS